MQEITNAVQRFFEAVDGRDWPGAGALMTDPFTLDYTSFGGGPKADLAPSDILDAWKTLLPGFDATQHHLGPLIVEAEGRAAQVRAGVIASHHIADVEGEPIWTIHGSYRIGLVRRDRVWLLSALTFLFLFQSGNPTLSTLAGRRVASR